MDYTIYELDFFNGVRFGSRDLSGTEIAFRADTLFAALYQEAIKLGRAQEFLEQINMGHLLFSDGFPYKGKQLFLPKPLLQIRRREQQQGNSREKKQLKEMKYIPWECLEAYREGCMSKEQIESGNEFGTVGMKAAVSLMGQEDPEPYRVSTYYLKAGNGLYSIVGYESEKSRQVFEELLESLSYTGLGGKKSAGLGRFEYRSREVPELLKKRLSVHGREKMLLSTAMAEEAELDTVLEGANYTLLRRGGFVDSERYALQQMRKKDYYVFAAGSCFRNTFSGIVAEDRNGGSHSVFRYQKALFLGVDI